MGDAEQPAQPNGTEAVTGPHRAVGMVRAMLAAYSFLCTLLVFATVAPPPPLIERLVIGIFVAAIALAVTWWFMGLPGTARRKRFARDAPAPTTLAWVPPVCVLVAFVACSFAISDASRSYYAERLHTYQRDVRVAAKHHTPRPPRPSATALPPWFGRLGPFFTVATQVLAGIVIILAFSRWGNNASSEALFRTAMPIAALGVAFGLAGNLPSLSPSLYAIFLGPVVAGLAGAIAALGVAATASRPGAP